MSHLRRLEHRDTEWLRERTAQFPAHYAFFSNLLHNTRSAGITGSAGTLLGYAPYGELQSAYWVGGSVIPLEPTFESNAAVADYLNGRGRWSCSLIGDAPAILDLRDRLTWGEPRTVRFAQPLLVANRAPVVKPCPQVRMGTSADFMVTMPSSVEMFTEEVGFSPISGGSTAYAKRVRSLLSEGSTYLVTSRVDGRGAQIRQWPAAEQESQVVFKADLGIRSPEVVQIQGVWVHPDFRGRGIGASAMAGVVERVRREVAPVVSLYVNDFNTPARKVYDRAGFEQVGTFATVMY